MCYTASLYWPPTPSISRTGVSFCFFGSLFVSIRFVWPTVMAIEEDIESCGSRAVEGLSQVNPRHHRQKLEVYSELLKRIQGSNYEEADLPGFDDQLWLHLNRLPARYFCNLFSFIWFKFVFCFEYIEIECLVTEKLKEILGEHELESCVTCELQSILEWFLVFAFSLSFFCFLKMPVHHYCD